MIDIKSIITEYKEIIFNSFDTEIRDNLLKLDTNGLRKYILSLFHKPSLYLPGRHKSQTKTDFYLDSLLLNITKYWKRFSKDIIDYFLTSDKYNILIPIQSFGGNLENNIKRLGIYFDTIAMVDPLHYYPDKSLDDFLNTPPELARDKRLVLMEHYAYLLKAMNYDFQNIDELPFLIIPEVLDLDKEKLLDDATKYLQKLYSDQNKIVNVDSFMKRINSKAQNELIAEINNKDLYQELIHRYERVGEYHWAREYDSTHYELIKYNFAELDPSAILRSLIFKLEGTIYAIKSSHIASIQFNLDPILFNGNLNVYEWLFSEEYVSKDYNIDSYMEEQIVAKALLGEQTNFLEAISIQDLQLIREEGMLESLRKSLRIERNKIKNKLTVENLEKSTQAFTNNMIALIKDYEDEYTSLLKGQKKQRYTNYINLSGSAALGALTFIFPEAMILAILSASTSLLLGGKSVRDLILDSKKNKEEIAKINKNPISILYGSYKNYNKQLIVPK